MNGFNETKEEVFRGCLLILRGLAEISSAEDLISHDAELTLLFKNLAFLKGLQDHALKFENNPQSLDNQSVNDEYFSNNIIEEPEVHHLTEEPEVISEDAPEVVEATVDADEQPQQNFLKEVEPFPSDKEAPVEKTGENHSENIPQTIDIENDTSESETLAETQKKFKLAQIKNLSKNQPSLFADEFSQESAPQALAKANMPLDFMEAPKPRPDFRLDLNDRIAFTQRLFGGSQTDLNDAVQALNRCATVDEAKEYLSDLYYEKNWKKADDYAQRLWTLVENKFL